MDAVAGLPLAEDGVEPIDLAGGDARIERFGDAVGELWERRANATAWRFSSAAATPLSAATALPRVPIRNSSDVARSAPTASSTRSLKAPANPCSAQNSTSAGRVD